MKCAVELEAIMKTNKSFNQLKEEANKKADLLEEEAREARIISDTLILCDDIYEKLENNVKNGINKITILMGLNYKGGIHNVVIERHKYANGKDSYTCLKEEYNLHLLVQTFENYCYNVELKEERHSSYGLGEQTFVRITIKPNPIC